MTTTRTRRVRIGREASEAPRRSISELQRDAQGILKEANERGEVEITRYGRPVAYVVAPEKRRRAQRLEQAATRTMVAMQYKRAMEDWEAGNVLEWEEVEARVRAIVGDL